MNRYLKAFLSLSFDAFAAVIALLLALELRFDFDIPGDGWRFVPHAILYGILTFNFFYLANLHRNIWHYTTTRDLFKLGWMVCLCAMVGGLVLAILTRLENFPRSVLILTPLIQMLISTGPRFILRTMHDKPFKHGLPSIKSPVEHVLLMGLNDRADLFVRETMRQQPKLFNVHGIIDDNSEQTGRVFHDIPVIGTQENLEDAVKAFKQKNIEITTIILTESIATPFKNLIEKATNMGLKVKRIPSISNLKDGSTLTDLKPVQIEDLLGRESVDLDISAVNKMVSGKNILVTGAGGSIGSELCRQILARTPSCLVCLESSEDALYKIEMELRKTYPNARIIPVLADVKETKCLNNAVINHNIHNIFHAAAYKHVPMVEANPIAGIENNLIGTANVTDVALANNVEHLVIISTDKAVNPTNIMGATKRASEIYALEKAAESQSNTKIMAVRFGNVLGSNGSVIPLFKKQLEEGGPLTVTHKDVTRYFMTIPEAVQLVLKASSQAENSALFMLDMGEPIKIWHLAEQMITLSGLKPYEDIEIVEVGLRPGEKLYEELHYDAETMEKTSDEKIFRVTKTSKPQETLAKYTQLVEWCARKDVENAIKGLMAFVPEYAPAENSPFSTYKHAHVEHNNEEQINLEKKHDQEST